MRYSVREVVPFPQTMQIPAPDYFNIILEQCRSRLLAEGIGALNVITQVRPWPRRYTENSANGYDMLSPRTGLDIIMTAETD